MPLVLASAETVVVAEAVTEETGEVQLVPVQQEILDLCKGPEVEEAEEHIHPDVVPQREEADQVVEGEGDWAIPAMPATQEAQHQPRQRTTASQ